MGAKELKSHCSPLILRTAIIWWFFFNLGGNFNTGTSTHYYTPLDNVDLKILYNEKNTGCKRHMFIEELRKEIFKIFLKT